MQASEEFHNTPLKEKPVILDDVGRFIPSKRLPLTGASTLRLLMRQNLTMSDDNDKDKDEIQS